MPILPRMLYSINSIILLLSVLVVDGFQRQRPCLERIWPDLQRCRDRQQDHFRYGRFSAGFSFSSDVYQPKYRTECCSYWELLECVHKSAQIYCSDEIDLKKLDKFVEMYGLNVPLYVCTDEYPKGNLRCKLPSWFAIIVFGVLLLLLVLLIVLFIVIIPNRGMFISMFIFICFFHSYIFSIQFYLKQQQNYR